MFDKQRNSLLTSQFFSGNKLYSLVSMPMPLASVAYNGNPKKKKIMTLHKYYNTN